MLKIGFLWIVVQRTLFRGEYLNEKFLLQKSTYFLSFLIDLVPLYTDNDVLYV